MKLYCVYIDEFGHVGPFVSRDHPRYNTSPIFGLGGILVPSEEVRNLGEFFLAHKARFLGQEMRAHGVTDPLTWEKKGSALYTAQNYTKYRRPLTDGTRRLLNRLRDFGGRTLYLGQKKTPVVDAFDPKELYRSTLELLLRKLDEFAASEGAQLLLVMDEHQDRDAWVDQAARMMYQNADKLRHFIEPPYQVESHRYQTVCVL